MAFSIALIAGASHTHWQWVTATRPDVHIMLPLSVPLPLNYGLRIITRDHAETMSSSLLNFRWHPSGADFAAHRRFMERRRVVAFGDVDGRAALWCGSLAFIAAVVVVPLTPS